MADLSESPRSPADAGPSREDLSVDEAVATVLASVVPGSLARERVGVEAAIGRVLAEALAAKWSLPGAPLSIMDGYAVRSADLIAAREQNLAELSLALVSESAAGHPSGRELAARGAIPHDTSLVLFDEGFVAETCSTPGTAAFRLRAHAEKPGARSREGLRHGLLAPGTCVRISTGAVVPPGADAVVPQEDTRAVGDQVAFTSVALQQVAPGRWIRPIGSDVEAGEALLDAGTPIGGGEASLLAGTGHVEVAVMCPPVVAILSSGDELVPIGHTPARGQIVSTNAMLLAAQIREAGGRPLALGNVPDDEAAIRRALEQAREQADVLVTTGGISVGDHDLILPVLEQLGVARSFRRVALRPGRPTTFGHLPKTDGRRMPVLALPGNPASSLVAFELFARPLLRALLGLPRHRWLRSVRAFELAADAEGDRSREHFVRAKLDADGRARPLAKQLSGALRSIADFDVLLRVPAGRQLVPAGESLPGLVLRA